MGCPIRVDWGRHPSPSTMSVSQRRNLSWVFPITLLSENWIWRESPLVSGNGSTTDFSRLCNKEDCTLYYWGTIVCFLVYIEFGVMCSPCMNSPTNRWPINFVGRNQVCGLKVAWGAELQEPACRVNIIISLANIYGNYDFPWILWLEASPQFL